jgi:transcriptional regulator with XRE-family HTH domain
MLYISLMRSAHLIREARIRSGMTQADLAGKLGTTQSAIARWETGGTQPSLETLTRVARACELELRIGLAEPDPGEVRARDPSPRGQDLGA